MRSGGGLLVTPLLSHSVDVYDALGDLREQFGRVEPAEALLRDEQGLPDHGRRVLHFLESLGRRRPRPLRSRAHPAPPSVDPQYPPPPGRTTFCPPRTPAITTGMPALSFSSPPLT